MHPKTPMHTWFALPVLAWALALLPACELAGGEAAMKRPLVTVVPQETDELLANPGMGWQTFHRTRDKDKNLPSWVPSTVHYARWGWGTVEPEPGKIDYAFLDKTLKQTREAGQTLAFRIMCCSTSPGRPYQPAWLKNVGGKEIECERKDTTGLLVPDLDDPVVLERHLDLIKRLAARYDGHGDIDHVDLGSVGWWGEWHMSGSKRAKMPTLRNCKRIVDAYFEGFKKTPLLMLIGGGECLTYATDRGAGWRADCLGDMGGFSKTWCHMRKAYPVMVKQGNVRSAWRTAPVAWESCWDMRKWVNEGWPLRFIFNYALAYHGSHLNNKSVPLPERDDVRPEIERFLRRLGYRLVLKELKHPARARAGGTFEISMKWQNIGSAPCYRPYRLAYRLTGGGRTITVVGNVTVNKWMPGDVDDLSEKTLSAKDWQLPRGQVTTVADRVTLPADVPAGVYRLSVGIVGQDTPEPVVRLGIQGRTQDGWYPLSQLEVSGA